MLTDEIIREIDREAFIKGTNRSNLVNQILAEYVSYVTPEKRADAIFRTIEEIMKRGGSIVPFVEPNNLTMSMKSSLEYKYRPTIRYEVQLYKVHDGTIGELSVIFRTQSELLLDQLENFFKMWVRLEKKYLGEYFTAGRISYTMEAGRLTRSMAVPDNRNYSDSEIADAISYYVSMFDTLMKGYLSGKISVPELESRYVKYLRESTAVI